MSRHARTIIALVRRALNEVLRVPGASLPAVAAPTIFMLGISSVFGKAAYLPHFPTHDFRSFVVPVGLLQGAGFTGAATGVNLARDIERGWFDRLLVSPTPRLVLLVGLVGSAGLRSLLPSSFLLAVAFAVGVHWPGLLAVILTAVMVMTLASVMGFWGVIIALRFRTQQAAPLMQIFSLAAVLCTTAYAPQALLTGWLSSVAAINPVTHVLEAVRQGFVSHVTWAGTWPALVSVVGLLVAFGGLAVRSIRRVGV